MANQLEVQPLNLPVARPAAIGFSEESDEGVDSLALLAIVWSSRWLILLCAVIAVLAAWVWLLRVTPLYTSTARIYVEQQVPRLLTEDPAFASSSSTYLYTQAEIIRSTPVLAEAIKAPTVASLAAIRQADNPIAFLKGRLSVAVGKSDDIINVAIELPDATVSSIVVNSVIDAYMTTYAERRRTDVVEILEILRNEKNSRDEELEQRRQDLEEYRLKHSELALELESGSVASQQYSTLAGELTAAEIASAEAKVRYEQAAALVADSKRWRLLLDGSAFNEVETNEELKREIQTLQRTLIAERMRWGQMHPNVRIVERSLSALRKEFQQQSADAQRKLVEKQRTAVKRQVALLHQEYQLRKKKCDQLREVYRRQHGVATDIASKSQQLRSLEEAYRRTAKTCDILDQRIREVNLTEDTGKMSVSVLEAAESGIRTYPNRVRVMLTSLGIGVMLGLSLALLRGLLDQRLKSIDEISSLLQLPVIGIMPLTLGGGKTIHDRRKCARIVELSTRSAAAEAVRTLRTALNLGIASDAKVLAITSPAPGDGKSTVASNLAIALAQADQRVLLIDADMRKPVVHKIFDIDVTPGLVDVLAGRTTVVEATISSDVASLDILPCGERPSNPVELLNNGVFGQTLKELANKYDRIVIDSPPVLPVADARLIATVSDCTLLVLRADHSTRRSSIAARDELLKARAARLGVAVNAVPTRRSKYGYNYSYYNYRYSGSYGPETYAYGDEVERSERSEKRLLRRVVS